MELFDLAEEYDEMLYRGLSLSGEDKHFFIRGRVQSLYGQLPPDFRPRRILDFGCGIGDTIDYLAKLFPSAHVVGVDVSEKALAYAERRYRSPHVSFIHVQALEATEVFDLCYTNGVFHHIPPEERPAVVETIYRALIRGGYFALFENNPWNLGTRLVMSRIPFDRNARLLSLPQAWHLLSKGGFVVRTVYSLFYFPRMLGFFRFLEPGLMHLPLGAQYCVLATKP